MALLRVLLNFTHATDHVLEETAGHVLAGLYGGGAATFPKPPVTQAALQAALTGFTSAVAAQKQGGPAATAAKGVAADALISLLRQLALYVQTVVQGIADPGQSMVALLSSGFEAVSNNRSQGPLDTPNINDIENVGTGRLKLDIDPVPNARVYEVQSKTGAGDWASAGLFQNSRGLIVTGLTPGTMYTFQVRAVGGSTGQSDRSNPVGHMSL